MANPLRFLLDEYARRNPDDQGEAATVNPLLARQGARQRSLREGRVMPGIEAQEGFAEGLLSDMEQSDARGASGSVMSDEATSPARQAAFQVGKLANIIPAGPKGLVALAKTGGALAAAAPLAIVKKLSAQAQADALRKAAEGAGPTVADLVSASKGRRAFNRPELTGPPVQAEIPASLQDIGVNDLKFEMQDAPASVRAMGATKQARELSAARRAAEAEELDAPVKRTAAERKAVEADKWRVLYQTTAEAARADGASLEDAIKAGEDAVIKAGQARKHFRRAADDTLVGFPRGTKVDDVKDLRKSADKQFTDANQAVTWAETLRGTPQRAGNWYERARAYNSQIFGPLMRDIGGDIWSTHSAGVGPQNENTFGIRHAASRAGGDPTTGFRGAQRDMLDQAHAQGVLSDPAFKISQYRIKTTDLPPEAVRTAEDEARIIALRTPVGTNDFRQAQNWQYTDPKGLPWKTGVTDQMHPVLDVENALALNRARKIDPTVTGEQMQAQPWVLSKGEDMVLQNKFKGATPLQSRYNALIEANNTAADYAKHHTYGVNREFNPGGRTGQRPDVAAMTPEGQRAYGDLWTRAPTAADPHPRDIPLSTMQGTTGQRGAWPALPPGEGTGVWTENFPLPPDVHGPPQQVTSFSPVTQVRPLVSFDVVPKPPKPKAGEEWHKDFLGPRRPETKPRVAEEDKVPVQTMSSSQRAAIRGIENVVALVDAQAAVAGGVPVTHLSRPGKTGVLLERMGFDKIGNPQSHLPTAVELKTVNELIKPHGYTAVPTPRGTMLLHTGGGDAEEAMRGLRKAFPDFKELEGAVPGSSAMPAAWEAGMYDQVTPREARQGYGAGTSRVAKRLAAAPASVTDDLFSSDEFRGVIKSKIKQDALAKATRGAKVSTPIQKTRELFANEPDKVRAWVKLIAAGKKPLAAAGLAGISLEGLAAEREDTSREPRP